MVPSTIAYSKSGLPDKLLKIFSKIPFFAQRPKEFVSLLSQDSQFRISDSDSYATILGKRLKGGRSINQGFGHHKNE